MAMLGGTVYSGAGTLIINGEIEGSVHGGGGSVVVNSKIEGDLFVGGGSVVISKSASVGDELFVGGGTVDIQGPVFGDAYMVGGTIVINSEIQGNVKIRSANKIKLGSNARITGNLEYNSEEEIEIEEGAVVLGETTIVTKKGFGGDDPSKGLILAIIFGIISLAILVKIMGLIVVGLVLIRWFKDITQKVIKESLTDFWKNLGIGLLALIVIPIVTIILLATIIGIWLGIIVGVLYVLSILLAGTLASITFGSWAIAVIRKNKDYSISWKVVVGGVVALALIKLIPVLGVLVSLVFMLISLGAIYRLAYRAKKS